jgi:hypothetical protein
MPCRCPQATNRPRFNIPARPGHYEATGAGLVNVGAALAYGGSLP